MRYAMRNSQATGIARTNFRISRVTLERLSTALHIRLPTRTPDRFAFIPRHWLIPAQFSVFPASCVVNSSPMHNKTLQTDEIRASHVR